MPQIPVGQTVNFTVGSYNSISRAPSSQVPGAWFYTVKGSFEMGEKLQGTAHLIWAMLAAPWPGAGGTLSITRSADHVFAVDVLKPGMPGPPKLEEYAAASKAYNIIVLAARAEDCPDMIGEAGPVTPAQEIDPLATSVEASSTTTVTRFCADRPAATQAVGAVTGPPTLADLFALAEACVVKASSIMEAAAEEGWTVETGTMISLAQSMQNNAWRSGLRAASAPPPQAIEEPQVEEPQVEEPPPPSTPPKTMAEAAGLVDDLLF